MDDPVKQAVRILNEALIRDPRAMRDLVNMRVECNDALAKHPTISVGDYSGVHKIGVLGLLNGVLGDSPSGVIGARGRMDTQTGRFQAIKEFVDLRDEKVDYLA